MHVWVIWINQKILWTTVNLSCKPNMIGLSFSDHFWHQEHPKSQNVGQTDLGRRQRMYYPHMLVSPTCQRCRHFHHPTGRTQPISFAPDEVWGKSNQRPNCYIFVLDPYHNTTKPKINWFMAGVKIKRTRVIFLRVNFVLPRHGRTQGQEIVPLDPSLHPQTPGKSCHHGQSQGP